MSEIERDAAKVIETYRDYGTDNVQLAWIQADAGLPRPRFEAAVKWLQRNDERVVFFAESNQKALTAATRAGAVTIGNQDRHYMVMAG